jgi:DNA-binding IclR family transcriptional regulator
VNSPIKANPQTPGVQSIERAIAILKAFSVEKEELGVTELSQQLNLPKSTVFRLLASLQREGVVEENPVTRKYRLGVALMTLGGLVLQRLDITQVARPFMRALADATQETVNLAIRDRDEAVNIAEIPSPQPVKYIGWVGRRIPLHCTSTGKILLAYLPTNERETLIACGLPRYTPNTITSPDLLRQELALVREQGYAVCHEEFDMGSNGVAAPIRDHTRGVVAVVSAAGPTFRLSPDRFSTVATQIQQTALILSGQLGYDGLTNPLDSQAISGKQKEG